MRKLVNSHKILIEKLKGRSGHIYGRIVLVGVEEQGGRVWTLFF
jgi:hypothetical protein